MLKVTKKQSFNLSLEDTFLEKRQGVFSLMPPPPPSFFRVKVPVSAFMAYSLTQSQLFSQSFMVFLQIKWKVGASFFISGLFLQVN